MTIINRETKAVESQSHRRFNWLGEGWAEVPPNLESAVLATAPYCELTFDETGTLVSVTPTARPAPVTDDPVGDLAELAVDHEYRLSLLELGVTDNAV